MNREKTWISCPVCGTGVYERHDKCHNCGWLNAFHEPSTARVTKEIPVPKYMNNPPKPEICPVCDGSGERIDRNTHKSRNCVACKGAGYYYHKRKA